MKGTVRKNYFVFKNKLAITTTTLSLNVNV
jgi:hypothetical protein